MKNKTIRKLQDLKERLHNMLYLDIYYELLAICNEFDDNDNDGIYLTDRIYQIYDFIEDDERMEYIIQEEAKKGLSRLRCFINTVQNNDIWYIDAYGNLEDVNDDVFINCIDELIKTLEG